MGPLGTTGIGQAVIRVGADTREARAQMGELTGQMQAQGAAMSAAGEKAGRGWGTALKAIKIGFVGVAVAVAAFAVEGVKAAAEFDKAMGKVYALTGISKKALEELRGEVLKLSETVPDSASKLAEGLYYVISAGYSGADALKILELSAMDAAAGLTDTQTVANGLTSAINAYGVGAEGAAHFSDIMTNTVTQGKMEWSQLASSIGAVSVQAATAGISFEETTAALATMTRVGLSSQRSSKNEAFLFRALSGASSVVTKEAKTLGIAFDSNTVKSKGLIGTLKYLSAAAGKHVDVLVKQKNGTIDYVKSAEATAKANTGWAAHMVKLTGGAAGFLAAQILLAKNAETYTSILKSHNKTAGMTVDAFEKMKEADPGVAFQLLKNRLMTLAIELGTTIMPTLTKVVAFFADSLPAAIKTFGDLWSTTVGPAVGEMVGAIGQLLGALGEMFFGWQGATKGADGTSSALQGVANAIAAVAKIAATAASALASIISNPIIQAAGRLLAIFVAMKVVLGGTSALIGNLNSRSAGLVRSLTGGRLGGGTAVAPADAAGAAMQAGGEKGGAALVAGGEKAAAALMAGAEKAAVASMSGLGGGALPGSAVVGRSAVGAYEQSLLGARGYGPTLAEAGMLKTQATGLKATLTGAASTGISAIKGGLSKAGSLIKGGLGLVSKAFWPLMIAGIATEFIKAPLGELIAGNTQFKRAGALMKEDFFGGLIGLVKGWATGSDLSSALSEVTLGGKTYGIGSFGKGFDLPDDVVKGLQAEAGSPEQAAAAYEATPEFTASLRKLTTETVEAYYARIRQLLQEKGISTTDIEAVWAKFPKSIGGGRGGPIPKPLGPAESAILEAAVSAAVQPVIDDIVTGTKTSLRQSVIKAVSTLTGGGMSSVALYNLTPEAYAGLARYLTAGAAGAVDPRLLSMHVAAVTEDANTSTSPGQGNRPVTAAMQAEIQSNRYLNLETKAGDFKATLDNAKAVYKEWQASLTPDQKLAANLAQAFLRNFGPEIRKAGTDPDKQKAVMDAINAMLPKDQQFLNWDDILAFKATAQETSGQNQRVAIANLTKKWVTEGARAGTVGAGANFVDLWGKDIEGADTTAAKAKVLKSINNLLPKGSDFASFGDLKTFYEKAVKDATTSANIAKPMQDFGPRLQAEFTEAIKGKTPTVGSVLASNPAVKAITDLVGGAVGSAFDAMKDWTAAYNGGKGVAEQFGKGIEDGVKLLQKSITVLFSVVVDNTPQSPVKKGPLKHPFLPNAGRHIVEQIAQGMRGAGGLPFPGFESGHGVTGKNMSILLNGRDAFEGKGFNQTIQVDRMHVHGDSSDDNILTQLAFLTRGGPMRGSHGLG